jgi:Outer membrane protein beta-barrel domain
MNERVLAVMAAAMLISNAARGAESGPYAGLFIGHSDHHLTRAELAEDDLRAGTTTFDSSLTNDDWLYGPILGVTAGWQFISWLSVEGSYSALGATSYRYTAIEPQPQGFDRSTSATLKYEPRAYAVTAIFNAPLSSHLSAGARAGVAYSRLKQSVHGYIGEGGTTAVRFEEEHTVSNIAPVYGLSVQFTPKHYLSFRIDWQRFVDAGESAESKKLDVDAYTFSALYRVAL